MKVLLTTLNAKYIHKNLALRWLYVAGNDPQNTFIKEFTINEDPNFIAERIVQHPAEIVAFSVYIWNIKLTKEVVRLIKLKSNKHIIMGGPEVTYESLDLLDLGVNALILGEGEISFWQYIEMLNKQENYAIAGVATNYFYSKQLGCVDLKVNETYQDPYFLAFDEAALSSRYLYLETSRGCPFNCAYCLSSAEQGVRNFSEAYIMKILEKIALSKVKIVKLLDRTFNLNPERALRLMRYMNDHCLNQIFQFEITADILPDALLDYMCNEMDHRRFRLEIGVQSFNLAALKASGRMQDEQRLIAVIKRLTQAGVIVHADLIAGLPYEDLDSFKNSFNRLFELHPSEIQLGTLKLLKGTLLRKKAAQFGLKATIDAPYEVTSTSWLTSIELKQLNNAAYAIDKILKYGYTSDPFSFFMQLGNQLSLKKRPYTTSDLFMCIKKVVSGDQKIIDAILNADYYAYEKIRPKNFLVNRITPHQRRLIQAFVKKQHLMDEQMLYKHTHLDTIFTDTFGYQLVVYANRFEVPLRYFIDVNLKEIKLL